jgi:hypothetical protein
LAVRNTVPESITQGIIIIIEAQNPDSFMGSLEFW